jgi:hypothetical protein
MAISSQGTACVWGGQVLFEATKVAVSGASASVVDVTGTNSGYARVYECGDVDLGTLSVEALGSGLSTAQLGTKDLLVITAPGGRLWASQAIFSGIDFACQVGEVTRWTFSFKLSGE